MAWDVFISHASEDKDAVARPLARTLEATGFKVWLDEAELTLGDSLRGRIDHGLAHSRYGIVILSPAFFAKNWPQLELDALAAKETDGRKVILPVWHGIDRAAILNFSPLLAGRLAVGTDKGLERVAADVARVLGTPSLGSSVSPSRSPDLSLALQPPWGTVRTPEVRARHVPATSFRLTENRSNPQWVDCREVPIGSAGRTSVRCRISTESAYFRFGFKLLRKDLPLFGDTKIEAAQPELLVHVGRNTDSRPAVPNKTVFLACYAGGQRIERDQSLFKVRKRIETSVELRFDNSSADFFVNEVCYQSRPIDPKTSERLLVLAWGDGNEVVVDVSDLEVGGLPTSEVRRSGRASEDFA